MTKPDTYTIGPDIPDDEVLRDTQGRLVDEPYVDAAVEEAIGQVRGRGRPSLSEQGESPLLRVRVPRDLDAAVRQAAEASGIPLADWVRRALEQAVDRT